MATDLCSTFKTLANRTWRRIQAANAMNLNWNEETATESLLLSLASTHKRNVKIKAFKKHEERSNGADWEWWFESRNGPAFGMRVQAKRIKLPDESFRNLGYRPPPYTDAKGDQQTSPRQIDTLIRMAKKAVLTPMYCLYIHSPGLPRGFWPNSKKPEKNGRYEGCMIGHAATLATALRIKKSNKLADLRFALEPWHNLVCSGTAKLDLVESAYAAATKLALTRKQHSERPDLDVEESSAVAPLCRVPK